MELTKFTIDLVNIGLAAGYLLTIFGLFILLSPGILLKINRWANKFFIDLDSSTFSHRIISGSTSIIVGSIILFILYYYL